MHFQNRSMFGFVSSLAFVSLIPSAFAQGPAPAPLMVHQLASNVYWVEGGGGNSGVIVGENVAFTIATVAMGEKLMQIADPLGPDCPVLLFDCPPE